MALFMKKIDENGVPEESRGLVNVLILIILVAVLIGAWILLV